MNEVENPRPDAEGSPAKHSSTSDPTIQEILAMRVAPTRNLHRLEVVKKRKDFCQPYKFNEVDSDKNFPFQAFKDDNLGLINNLVMEIG